MMYHDLLTSRWKASNIGDVEHVCATVLIVNLAKPHLLLSPFVSLRTQIAVIAVTIHIHNMRHSKLQKHWTVSDVKSVSHNVPVHPSARVFTAILIGTLIFLNVTLGLMLHRHLASSDESQMQWFSLGRLRIVIEEAK